MIDLPDGPPVEMSAREAARRRFALDGANAQALEGALSGVERLLRDLLAAIHGDGGQHEQRHGLEESCRQAHARIADLRRALDAAKERLLACNDELAKQSRLILEAEERGAQWVLDELGAHARRENGLAHKICQYRRAVGLAQAVASHVRLKRNP